MIPAKYYNLVKRERKFYLLRPKKNCDIFQRQIFYSKSKYFSSQQKVSKPQLNQYSSQPQRNITLVMLDTKMTLHSPQKLIASNNSTCSCYLPDFDETLKVCSWEHLEQIPNVMMTFFQATFVLATFVHIRNISALTDPILMKL